MRNLSTNKSNTSGIILAIMVCALNFIGCATISYVPAVKVAGVDGIYHRIEKGQTLFRISKIYNVNLDELVRINKIEDVRKIEVGRLVFIPGSRNISEDIENINFSKFEDFIWPLKGTVISYFGQSDNNMINKGIDIQAPYGYDVIASRSGLVCFYASNLGRLGKTLIIDHGEDFLTVYARVSTVSVKVGDRVSQGKGIAKVGCAANDKNSYLHFEIRRGHIPKNPYYYLP